MGYGRECLETAVALLEKICKAVKPARFTKCFTDIPVACMCLVAKVLDFAEACEPQVCETKDNN